MAPGVTAGVAPGHAAALARSRPSPHAPDDHQGRVAGLPAGRAGRGPPEGDPSAWAASPLGDAAPRSGGGSTAAPTLARPSEPPDDAPILADAPACPPCDAEPPGEPPPGDPVMRRPVLAVADGGRQYGEASRALARRSRLSSGVSGGPWRPAGRPLWEAT